MRAWGGASLSREFSASVVNRGKDELIGRTTVRERVVSYAAFLERALPSSPRPSSILRDSWGRKLATMEDDLPTEYDVVVVGTGIDFYQKKKKKRNEVPRVIRAATDSE